MNAKELSLAFAALTLLSTTAANAQVTYGSCGATVVSSPAVVAAPGYDACGPALFGRHTWRDNGVDYRPGLFGGLLGLNGPAYGPELGYSGYGVNSFAAVVPGTCGAAAVSTGPVCGQRISNSLFDIRLFGLGLGLGRVNPHMDMRPAGSAL